MFTDIGNTQIARERTKLYLICNVTTTSAGGERGREPVGVCALDIHTLFNVRVNRDLRLERKEMNFIKGQENESLSETFRRWKTGSKTMGKLVVKLGAALEGSKTSQQMPIP